MNKRALMLEINQLMNRQHRDADERRKLREAQEATRRQGIARFDLAATEEGERFTELLRIAYARGFLKPVQNDPRVKALEPAPHAEGNL